MNREATVVEFTTWYEREAAGVCRSLSIALGDAGLAEDVAAEAFARAWADWNHVAAMSSPVGWVYRVALNDARSRHRRRQTEQRLPSADIGFVPAPSEPAAALWEAVALLPDRARLAIALRYVADLPESEVAELMGIARGTVAATLHSARQKLAASIERPDREVIP